MKRELTKSMKEDLVVYRMQRAKDTVQESQYTFRQQG